MSKISIRDLFGAQKKDNSSTQSVAESLDPSLMSIDVAFNKQAEVPEWTSASSDFVNFNIVETGTNEIPDFFSESSTVSLLSGVDPPTGRIVAASGANLCLARGDGLWILDMTTGMSNDRSISCIKRPIRDMELASSFLAFTDGIDVGVIKITGNNGSSQVGLLGYVYLASVGTESDPVVSVQWHPTSSQSFVTIRASAGWTLWDLVRLQSKSVSGNDLLNDVSVVPPALFKTFVGNPTSVAEGVHPWTSASNVIAGKKLSPGVLAILKRGDVSPEAKRNAASSSGSFKAFSFSSDGSLAVAALSNGIKVWTIGHRCSAVSYLSSGPSSEDEWNRITGGRDIRSLISLDDNKFVMCTDRDIGYISVEKSASHIRTLSLSTSVDLCCLSRVGSSNLILAGGRHTKTNSGVLILLSDQSICVTPLAQESISSIAAAPTLGGNSDQVAIYAAGKSISGAGTMWTAQTLDLSIYRDRKVRLGSYEQISSEMVEASPLNEEEEEEDDDFPLSDAVSSMAAPERLESAVTLTRPASQRDAEEIRRMKAELVENIKNDVGRIVNDEISINLKERFAKQQRDVQSHIDKEARRMESLIEKLLKDKFSSAIQSAMHEITTQIEARIDEKFEAFRRSTLQRNNEMMGQVDELIAVAERISKHHQSTLSAGPSEPPALIEIRRFINAGEHLQAISTATQWWKLNQPIAAGQPDLLAITCAAIASQIRQGESMRDTASGCYMLLVLTEWTKLNSSSHADRTVAVLRSAKFVLSCLFASPVNVSGETMELCYKSLSKSVRNAAAIVGNGDRTVDDLSRDVLSDIREFMMRFTSSRVSTPTASSAVVPNQPGATILQMLRRQ